MREAQRGTSLLGVLISLTLVSALLIPSFISLLRLCGERTAAAAGTTRRALLTQRTLALAVRSYDTHRFPISPRIMGGGIFTLHNGDPLLPVPGGELAPHPEADAIAALSLMSAHARVVEKCARDGSTVILTHCPRTPGQAAERYEHALLIGTFGTQEVLGIFHSGEGCATNRFHPEESMMVSSTESENLCFSRALIPITRIFTLYLSVDGTLRYLGHQGKRIIENQPIESGLTGLSLALRAETVQAPLLLRSHVEFEDEKTFSAVWISQMRRSPLWEFLFNG